MASAFRRINNSLTPARGSENASFQPNIGLKDGFTSGRKHNRPKQAFGELKNILHNHEPTKFSNNIKKNIFENLETPKKCEQKKNIKYDLKPQLEDFDYYTIPKSFKSTEEQWAEKIGLSNEEFDRILAPQWERNHTITMEEVSEIIKRDCEEIGENALDKILEEEFGDMNHNTEDKELYLPHIDDIPVIEVDYWDLKLLDLI